MDGIKNTTPQRSGSAANPQVLYSIIYALAAQRGREAALFGTCGPAAQEAFEHSMPTDAFPELWFEIPLAGKPWMDFHALTARDDLDSAKPFTPETTGGNPDAFAWFAAQQNKVRQLALSWDTSSGSASNPAVQLLVSSPAPITTCEFLKTVGRSDAVPAYRAFFDRLPKDWFACYTGVFPQRPGHNLRVECIPSAELQQAYAHDANLLQEHLRQVGLSELGETIAPRCQTLANTPFQLEFQFDVDEDGFAGPTFGASVRFSRPSESPEKAYNPNGAAGELMRKLVSWGLVDERWQLLADTMFAKRFTLQNESAILYCFPTFVKLRWREGVPLDAKAYLIAGVG